MIADYNRLVRILHHAVNGVGLGHLVRLSWLARAIERDFPQAVQMMVTSSAHGRCYFAGESVLIPCDLLDRAGHEQQFARYAAGFAPDVVVCDTRWPERLFD